MIKRIHLEILALICGLALVDLLLQKFLCMAYNMPSGDAWTWAGIAVIFGLTVALIADKLDKRKK